MNYIGRHHRSRVSLGAESESGRPHDSVLKEQGFGRTYRDRPVIGIYSSWSELSRSNVHLRSLTDAVKRGVWQAGGLPLEFPVAALGEFKRRSTTLILRNLLSMEIEELITSNPLDGVLLLGGCDDTLPALLLGAVSANLPALLLTVGPQLGSIEDPSLHARYEAVVRNGKMSRSEWSDLEDRAVDDSGYRHALGAASTMAILGEALGMALPGDSTIPAVHTARLGLSEEAGRQIVELVQRDLRPSKLLTRHALENAVRTLHAIAGSSDAILHLTALAGRVGIDLALHEFDELSLSTPVLLNLKPRGEFLMDEFFRVGGVPALLRQLAPCLKLNAITCTGRTLRDNLERHAIRTTVADAEVKRVIRPLEAPIRRDGGMAALRGSLAPAGAVIRYHNASKRLRSHVGRAVVFESREHLLDRIDSPDLDVEPGDVIILRNVGPIGGPGMPDCGLLPIPKKLLDRGVRDIVRVSDGRFGGTPNGTVVTHVTPEAAAGGPLAAVEDGDPVRLDVDERRLDLLLDSNEVARRLFARPRPRPALRGFVKLYQEHVLQADKGCDFDFLRASGNRYVFFSQSKPVTVPTLE